MAQRLLARRAGLGFMSSSVARTNRGIARQRASTSGNFSISRRVTTLNEKIDWPTPKVSVTSTPRLIYWRDTLSISGPRIFYSATGDVFRRIFLPTPREQKGGNIFRRCAAAQVAHIGPHDKLSVVAISQEKFAARESFRSRQRARAHALPRNRSALLSRTG